MNRASTQTYTTWPGSKSTGMPQEKLVRLTHRSSRPGLMKLLTISLTRERGCRKSVSSSRWRTRSAYLLRRKK